MKYPYLLLCGLAAAMPARAAVYAYDTFDSLAGGAGFAATGWDGGSIQSVTSAVTDVGFTGFAVGGQSAGAFAEVTRYSYRDLAVPVSFATNGLQDSVYVGFLFARDSRNAWAGGVTLYDGAGGVLTTVGWNSQLGRVTVTGRDESNLIGTDPVSLADNVNAWSTGSSEFVYVLARIYEKTIDSGLMDTVSLWVDDNLSDGIQAGQGVTTTRIANALAITGTPATALGRIRLNADGDAETRFFDNLSVASTAPEAINPTAIPEPSTYGFLGAGALGAVALVRRRRKAAR